MTPDWQIDSVVVKVIAETADAARLLWRSIQSLLGEDRAIEARRSCPERRAVSCAFPPPSWATGRDPPRRLHVTVSELFHFRPREAAEALK